MRIKSLLLLLFVCALSRGQQLTYLGGSKFAYGGNKLDARQLEFALHKQPQLLDEYQTAKTKRDIGNVLYVAGTGLAAGSLIAGLTADHFSAPAAIAGLGAIVIAVPVKAGFRKRMQHVAFAYDQKVAARARFFDVSICATGNAIGLKATF